MDTLTTTDLPCPKCRASMRRIERSGIHIEQCVECRGVFLDRGELDHLLDLEAASLSRSSGRSAPDQRQEPARFDGDDDDAWEGSGRRRPDRRGGFLSELFQNFGD